VKGAECHFVPRDNALFVIRAKAALVVIPAHAGIQPLPTRKSWTPAFAGVTKMHCSGADVSMFHHQSVPHSDFRGAA
jgi:hypothetical protein